MASAAQIIFTPAVYAMMVFKPTMAILFLFLEGVITAQICIVSSLFYLSGWASTAPDYAKVLGAVLYMFLLAYLWGASKRHKDQRVRFYAGMALIAAALAGPGSARSHCQMAMAGNWTVPNV
jgi:hypothetical protein